MYGIPASASSNTVDCPCGTLQRYCIWGGIGDTTHAARCS